MKLYAEEPDSRFFLRLAASSYPITVSTIAAVELQSALTRKEKAGNLYQGARTALMAAFDEDRRQGRVVSLDVTDAVIAAARSVMIAAAVGKANAVLRSLDAIQVASALSSGSDTIVSTDARMREVARDAGLKVIPG